MCPVAALGESCRQMQPSIENIVPLGGLDIGLLPRDIFLIILNQLSHMDVIQCRRVSRSWNAAFSNPCNLYPWLKYAFPLAREFRQSQHNQLPKDGPEISPHDDHWRKLFNRISARYFHLSCGKPQSVERYKVWPSYTENILPGARLYPVPPWEAHSSHTHSKPDTIFGDCFWTYEDGLLAYISRDDACVLLRDLETSSAFRVPFILDDRVIRRIRLKDRLLLIEWAEADAFHWLNGLDSVHRHFASSFDIKPCPMGGWDISFRNEWKIMFLGHPLSDRDRFYSSHSGSHYVVYAWQPNRSLYTSDEDAPIESLFVWDISEPSDYRPSTDPSGLYKPAHGPFVVARFSFRDLEFHSVRQRGEPKMIRLDIDSENGVLNIVESACTLGVPNNPLPIWSSHIQITSIPFLGPGPSWRRHSDLIFPPYRGNASMHNSSIRGTKSWFPCVSEIIDEESQICFTLQIPMSLLVDGRIPVFKRGSSLEVKIQGPGISSLLEQRFASEIEWKGCIYGDERFVIGENDEHELVILRFDR
ncbi:hypothetical protein AJ79_02012 [Helicocarpus griseus UAMH5409]|uniref:F-box domain-containing protein n=1 Tax=Helicocarpus griseus UAMH5409 TaxID=1447875 RepID=A0A2B7Y580_9EURO|nr:hypothetical protein AJ79_02012 [Helicocarpus griseus UAMH5409]